MSKPFLAIFIAFAAVLIAIDPALLSPGVGLQHHQFVAVSALAVAAAEPLAYSIREFCRAHNIATCTYYGLKRDGLGPREMRMGSLIRISTEAAAEWRRQRENPDAAEAEALDRGAEQRRERAITAVSKTEHVSKRKRETT
jgi:hypothetical protein